MLSKIEQVLFFLTVLLLPTQLGRHFWPPFSYIYSLRIDYLSPTVYLWDLLVLALVLVFSFGQRGINQTALKLILLFLASQALSLLPHLNEINILGPGLVRLEEYIFVSLFGLYVASLEFSEAKKLIFRPLAWAILIEAVLAIGQFLKGGTLGLWILGERSFNLSTAGIAKFDFYGREFLRPYASFPHPNVLAAFMVLVPLIIFWLGLPQKGWQALWVKLSMLLASLAVLLTVSRVVILVGLVNALVFVNKKGRIGIVVVILVLSPILYTRYASTLNFDNLSLIRREELSETAFKMWLGSPITGAGLNNFIPKASADLLAGPSRFLQPVHNIYLLALSETGLLGLGGFLIWLGYPIIKLFKDKKLFLIWLSVLFLGLFDHYFLTLPQGYRLLFLLWGTSMSMLEAKTVIE